jgi:beta-carotene hydroxylase
MTATLETLNASAIASAQERMGHFAPGTVLLAMAVTLGYVGTLWLFAGSVLPAWSAALLIAALTYASYTPLHEAAHGNINGRHAGLRWLNELCGIVCAQMIMLPHASHRLEHMNHHRHTNDPERDPDFHISAMGRSPLSFLMAPWRLLWIHSTFIFRHHWHRNATRIEKCQYLGEVMFGLGWRVAFLMHVPLLDGLLVIAGGYAVGAFFTIYWFAYRPHWPYRSRGRYADTCSMIVPRWLKPFEWIWLGQTLHSVHHAFPRVPFYRYHGLFREVEGAMRAHGGEVVEIFSRRPVPLLRDTGP